MLYSVNITLKTKILWLQILILLSSYYCYIHFGLLKGVASINVYNEIKNHLSNHVKRPS